MTMKHIIQPSLEILLGFGFSDDFPCQMNLVTQRIPVQFHKMPVNGNGDECPQANEHEPGSQRKKDRQPCRERVPGFHTLS